MQEKQTDSNNKQSENIQLADDITKEQVIALLKDKIKDNNRQIAIQKKLEERYTKIISENKLYKKDYEALIRFLKSVFNNYQGIYFSEKQLGELDYNELIQLLEQRDATKVANDSELNNQFEETQLDLNKEIDRLNKLLGAKDEEINRLKQLDKQLQIVQAEVLLKELQSNKQKVHLSTSIGEAIKESELTNELLQLKNQIELKEKQINDLQIENESLKNANKQQSQFHEYSANNDHSANLIFQFLSQSHQQQQQQQPESLQKQQLQQSNQLIRKFSQQLSQDQPLQSAGSNKESYKKFGIDFSCQTELQLPMLSQTNSLENGIRREESFNSNIIKSNMIEQEKSPTVNLNLNQQYLKNILLKYFTYSDSGRIKEANVLKSVIFTILKLNSDEKKLLEEAKKSQSIWQTTKNYINDNFFSKSTTKYYQTNKQVDITNLKLPKSEFNTSNPNQSSTQ